MYFKMTRLDQYLIDLTKLTIINLSQFLNLPGTEKRRLCDTLFDFPLIILPLAGLTDVETENVWVWERTGVQLSTDFHLPREIPQLSLP